MATHMGNAWRKWGLATRLEGAGWLWKHDLVKEDRAAGENPQKKWISRIDKASTW